MTSRPGLVSLCYEILEHRVCDCKCSFTRIIIKKTQSSVGEEQDHAFRFKVQHLHLNCQCSFKKKQEVIFIAPG